MAFATIGVRCSTHRHSTPSTHSCWTGNALIESSTSCTPRSRRLSSGGGILDGARGLRRVLFRNADGVEQILDGTGVSADDVLNEAFLALLEYPPDRLESKWEGLAVKIAENKAIDALRASQKGLRRTDHRIQLHLVSGDAEREGPDGETEPSIFEGTPGDWGDPEAEYLELEAVLKLRDFARELLDDRQQGIFFAIHFGDYTRREVGEQLGLTSQRIGQIYNAALLTLEAHHDYPFKPPLTVGQLSERRKL